jgi:tRNA(Arg) A34 adenosine deaminase TadA
MEFTDTTLTKNHTMIIQEKVKNAMQRAVEMARKHKTPFGAALLSAQGEILLVEPNTVALHGPLAHAEMNLLIRAQELHVLSPGQILVSTCEPCAMCMGAILWCGIGKVIFGASIAEAAEFIDQIEIEAKHLSDRFPRSAEIIEGIEKEACLRLFQEFT